MKPNSGVDGAISTRILLQSASNSSATNNAYNAVCAPWPISDLGDSRVMMLSGVMR